jgi:hypothetical protein
MNLGEFIIKYYGKKVDFDGMYGAQCVDLARQYWKEVWGVPQPEGVVGAKEFYTNYEQKPTEKMHMERTQCAMRGQPIPSGAVVLFGSSTANEFGHIGICINTEGETINLLEQDGFKQDGVKISKWTYERVLGWLTKRDAA